MKKELICIVCPKGCHLTAEEAESGWNISGRYMKILCLMICLWVR